MRITTRLAPAYAAAALAFATSAHAQSSVTLYGLVDAGVAYVRTNTGNQFSQLSGALHGDRWGMRGTEDLGGGLSAIFDLENGFNIATGALNQGGREFGRQAFVGLSSRSLGTLTLGRQYDPVVDLVQGATADLIYGGTFGTPGDIDNYDNNARINNAVKYKSPTYRGLTFEALYGFSGTAGAPGQGQSWGSALQYASGPVTLAAGYFYSSNASSNNAVRTAWNAPTADSFFKSPINDGYQSASAMAIARASGSYVIGSVTLGASYSNVQYKHDAQSLFHSGEHVNAANFYVSDRITRSTSVGVGYTFTKASGDTSATYHQANIGVLYDLSRSTTLYALGGYQHASGQQRTASGGIREAEASIGSLGIAGGTSQELAIVGVLHRF
ncbi:porin [Paraburkholderia dipogonis]|uniref:porin n=1 Tax=Paraburkholderia dipogonis TaxID=1211383 RepID=UPI0038BD1F80